MRGFKSEFSGITKHSLLLIDGPPAATKNLSTFTLGNIGRIEVLKGPASSLYGAKAMGGVEHHYQRSTGKTHMQYLWTGDRLGALIHSMGALR